ncbi:MAG: GNAT family N-acetyltransferase [Acutalibacteraceae bacterium]
MSNLRVAKTEEFDKIFSILENSFPPDEYRTYEGQKSLWNHPKYTVYVIPDDESDCIKAFITVWKFEDFAFIEHFAVNPFYRNQGLGSLILHEILNLLPVSNLFGSRIAGNRFCKKTNWILRTKRIFYQSLSICSTSLYKRKTTGSIAYDDLRQLCFKRPI